MTVTFLSGPNVPIRSERAMLGKLRQAEII
jgi:hypothetical protein